MQQIYARKLNASPKDIKKFISPSHKPNHKIQHWLWRVWNRVRGGETEKMNLFALSHDVCVWLKSLKTWASSHFWCIQWMLLSRMSEKIVRSVIASIWHIFDACWIFSLVAVWKSDRKSVEKPQTELFIHDFDMEILARKKL